MDEKNTEFQFSLSEWETPETLKLHYRQIDDQTLLKWVQAVKGTHQQAMIQLLRDRGYPMGEE